MAKKLNFRFHNPNTTEGTADFLLHILLEANRGKLETLLDNPKQHLNTRILEDRED